MRSSPPAESCTCNFSRPKQLHLRITSNKIVNSHFAVAIAALAGAHSCAKSLDDHACANRFGKRGAGKAGLKSPGLQPRKILLTNESEARDDKMG